jgi:diaminopimelate decarboxylase
MISIARKMAKHVWLRLVRHSDQRQRQRLGMQNRDLTPEFWDAAVGLDGHLVIGGCDVVRLAAQYGTPLHVVDRERLRKNYVDFLGIFRRHYPHVDVFYSYKTNPLPGVLHALHEFGAGAEVISHFELWLALKLGVLPDRVIFNGPAKTESALALAVSRDVGLINVDNIAEIDTIQRLASAADRVQKVGVRVITSVGWSAQFGLSIRDGSAWEAFKRAKSCPNLDPCALHFHLGTGIKDIDIYLQAIREVLEFADDLHGKLHINIRIFDFGGGFGVPTVRTFSSADMRLMKNGFSPRVMDVEAAPQLASYAALIAELFLEYRKLKGHEDPVIIFEPGRAITSNAQTLLLRVLAVKPAREGKYNIILDGGQNVATPPTFEYHEILPASKMHETRNMFYDLFGPLCYPADVLCIHKPMPQLDPGDVVAVMDAGAYFIPNQKNFSNPRCAAVMVDSGTAKLIRKRESFKDIIHLDDFEEKAGLNLVIDTE